MLELKNIKKDYPAGGGVVHALRGVSLRFRESEFVSILGPSGCGKTTMLNIIGGLDGYTEGDLVINGRSTRGFRDRDWDSYRNHSIGFVFQSYNLIPHQTVLQNVELSLTLTGVGKAERRARARRALEQVGLGSQLKKRPGEMSGGQMQRVAIARALVNDPDIILADEPTGALDTETSIQVMEILKDVARDRLVIMVTHNPQLAERYSTRIVRMLDGEVQSDSMPLSDAEAESLAAASRERAETESKRRRPSMSFLTAFSLSLKNLATKKGRTALTAFAGSIGIIGIALIFAVSHGMTAYINALQEDTLSSYPLTIEAQSVDLTTLMQAFMGAHPDGSDPDHGRDAVYRQLVMYDMANALNSLDTAENDLVSFKEYVERECADENSALHGALSGVQYSYGVDLAVYTKNAEGEILRSDTQELLSGMISKYMGFDMSAMMSYGMGSSSSRLMGMGYGSQMWEELLSGDGDELINPLLRSQYDLVYGAWPENYDEIVLVLNENNELDDLTLYALGMEPTEEIEECFSAVADGKTVEAVDRSWSYEEICKTKLHAVIPAECYSLDEAAGTYTDLRETDAGLRYVFDNGIELRVSGIIRPSEQATSSMLRGAVGYTRALTEYVIDRTNASAAVRAQQDDPETDIFTGLPFPHSGEMTDGEKAAALRDYIASLDEGGRAAAYAAIKSTPSEEQLAAAGEQYRAQLDRSATEKMLAQTMSEQTGMSAADISAYISNMSDDDFDAMVDELVRRRVTEELAAAVQAQLAAMSPQQLAAALEAELPDYTDAQCAAYYDAVVVTSDSSYDENLERLGAADLDSPKKVNLFASSFENKDVIEDAITDYNASVDELHEIRYTDYVGLMMSSVTSIINAVTYVLIAFVAISLIVSSIMIGVITLISVQERTKEIGILRAIGASKRDVSSMFNAETVMIGFAAGLLGVVVSSLLCIPINIIIHDLTGISTLSASLPLGAAAVLVAISVFLTLIAGIIPSRSAARKDPVVALRTE